MSENFQQLALIDLMGLLDPLLAAAESAEHRRRLLADLGWDLEAMTGFRPEDLDDALRPLTDTLAAIRTAIGDPPDSLEEIGQALETARQLFESISALSNAPVPAPLPELSTFGRDLLEFLPAAYLRRRYPPAFALGELLTLIESRPVLRRAPAVPGDRPPPDPLWRLRFSRIAALLGDPVGELRARYAPSEIATAQDAQAVANGLFPRLAALLRTLNVRAVYGLGATPEAALGATGTKIARGALAVDVHPDLGPSLAGTSFGATFALSSAEEGDLGLVVAPFGTLSVGRDFGAWRVDLEFTSNLPGFAVGRHGLTLLPEQGLSRVQGSLRAARLPDEDGRALLIGGSRGTHFEASTVAVRANWDFGSRTAEYGVLLEVLGAQIVVSGGDGDGFLRAVLPAEGIRTAFDLAVGWSCSRGLHFRGSASLQAELPVHAGLGPVRVDTVWLSLGAEAGGAVVLEVAATAALSLGNVVSVSVKRMGLQFRSDFPGEGGNLGAVDVSPRFKPPAGAGLLIDAGPVSGGGYLEFDPAQAQYAGVLQLDFKSISLKAIGLLTTRLPEGLTGYSLLVIITAEFTPVQLGFGFTLNGVGGLLGFNRTIDVDALRAGVRSGAVESILFPTDPVRNAPELLSNLRAFFPPAPGRYAFGPMVMLGWGTPPILIAELAVALELPSPVRLLVMGRLRVVLPTEEFAIVRIRVDVLGIVDFDRREASVDAALVDSRLGTFPLTGEMAMRASWATDPSFALAAGGLNPRFQPPTGFPSLHRLALALGSGDNPRLRLECYFAVTSNSLQFGARADVYAAQAGFSIEGVLGFDALLRFNPLEFVVDIVAAVALRRGSRTLMSVGLELMLSGPSRWHVRGRATFTVLKIKGSVSFDRTFGSVGQAPTLPSVDVQDRLLEELDRSGNWAAQLPAGEATLVSLRAPAPGAGEVLAHPLGTLTVRQRVVPLNRTIERFGGAAPAGERRFVITAEVNGAPGEVTFVREMFAPAQFLDLSDAEKLSRPSFESMDAGVQLASAAVATGAPVQAPVEYEEIVIDEQEIPLRRTYQVTRRAQCALAEAGAVARGPRLQSGAARFRGAPVGIALDEPAYVVATAEDLSVMGVGAADGFTAAVEALQRLERLNPGLRGRLQVVAAHEVAQ